MKCKQLFLISHLIVGASALVLLLSGLRIASQQYAIWLELDWLLPSGLVHVWHMRAGLCLLVSLPIMLFCLYRNRKEVGVLGKLNVLGSGLLIASLSTGVLQFVFDFTGRVILELHYYLALGFIGFITIHPLRYYFSKPLSYLVAVVFRPLFSLRGHIYAGVIVVSGLLLYFIILSKPATLNVSSMSDGTFIRIDGKQEEAAWDRSAALSVTTFAGANFFDGSTDVLIKALHNSSETYFFVRWKDPTKSENHLPIVKTSKGWIVKSNGFEKFDEKEFYEDKFAMLFSKSCNIAAAGTAHLGARPSQALPVNSHGKGYHYTEQGIADLWQWKAVRTNAMHLMDDNYIGMPPTPISGVKRYTAGYQQDADYGGSYVMNWRWYNKDGVTPKRAPIQAGEDATGFASWFDYRSYDADEDTLPEGSVIKSVLYRSNQIEGGRADVRAFGVYEDGYWNLEVVRKKQASEPTDLNLDEGVCMWVSAFDRAQIAHTRHVKPLKLRFE